jgi:HK97 family phage major capsid protein
MADGAIPAELKTQLDGFQKTLHEIRTKSEEQEKRGASAASQEALAKLEAAHNKHKDFINAEMKKRDDEIHALHKKANRPVVSPTVYEAKATALETKANREVARWLGGADETKAAAFRVEYKTAFERYLRLTEKALTLEETKALSVGSSPDGGYFVDPFRAQTLIDKIYETSALRAVAPAIGIGSNSYEEPIDRDEPTTGWVGEQSARPETNTPQVGKLIIPVHEQYALVKSTQNLLDDAGINVEQWLDGKVTDEMVRQENTAFVTGNGVSKPMGFTSYTENQTDDATRAFGVLQSVKTGSNGAFRTASATVSPADDLLDLIYKFKPGYRQKLRWGGNRVTLGAVRKFKDQNGNFIYDARLGANGIIDTVFGYPWDEFADMTVYTTTGALGIVLADWSRGYIIVDRQGMRQLRDPYTSKGYVLFYTYKRVGGGVRDSDAVKFVKFST